MVGGVVDIAITPYYQTFCVSSSSNPWFIANNISRIMNVNFKVSNTEVYSDVLYPLLPPVTDEQRGGKFYGRPLVDKACFSLKHRQAKKSQYV